jgi:hypothetical protein
MKKCHSEDEIKAQLRGLTAEVPTSRGGLPDVMARGRRRERRYLHLLPAPGPLAGADQGVQTGTKEQ